MKSIKWAVACLFSTFLMVVSPFSMAEPEVLLTDERQVVHLNSADVDTLASVLKGVGLKRAQKIVEYRSEHGSFESVEDLIKVKGIGMSILEKNRGKIML